MDGDEPRQVWLAALEDLPPNRGIFGGLVGFDWSPQSQAVVASFDVSLCDQDLRPNPYLAGLYRVEIDGSNDTRLVEGATRDPVWSPSGDLVAYVAGSFLDDPSVPAPIQLVDLGTGTVADLATGLHPAWQPGT